MAGVVSSLTTRNGWSTRYGPSPVGKNTRLLTGITSPAAVTRRMSLVQCPQRQSQTFGHSVGGDAEDLYVCEGVCQLQLSDVDG